MVNSWEHRIQDNGANNKNTNWTGTPRCRKCLVALLLYSGWQIDVSVRCSDATTTSQTGAIYIVHSSAMWPRGLPLLLVDRRTAPETLHISSHRRLLLSFFLRSSRGYLQKTEQLRQVPAFWCCFMCFSIYINYLPRNAENRGGHRSNGCVQFLPPLPCCLTCSGDSDFLPLLNAVVPPSQFCRITLSRQETPNSVGGGGGEGGGGGWWWWWWWWWWGWWWWWWRWWRRRRRWWWEEDDDVEEEDVEEEGRSQDIPRPGSTPCASLRRRNEHGHVTRGVLHASDTTSTEYRALTLTVRTPQCGHTVWGKLQSTQQLRAYFDVLCFSIFFDHRRATKCPMVILVNFSLDFIMRLTLVSGTACHSTMLQALWKVWAWLWSDCWLKGLEWSSEGAFPSLKILVEMRQTSPDWLDLTWGHVTRSAKEGWILNRWPVKSCCRLVLCRGSTCDKMQHKS